MTGMTLLEALKLGGGTTYRDAVINLFAQSSEPLAQLPFIDIVGNAYKYNVEESLPGVGFRGYNEGYTASAGVLNPQTETISMLGGDLDVDKKIVKHLGQSARSRHEALKIKALAGKWTKTFIKGDTETDPKEFSGLQSRIQGNQLISAGTTANGAALSLAKMDELIDAVDNPTHLIMSRALRTKFKAAARTTSVGGYVTFDRNELGAEIMFYGSLPILAVDKDNEYNDILGFNEAASSGTSTATSVYCISATDDGVVGLQNGGIEVEDLGELETKPVLRTRIEWDCGMAVFRGTAAARLQHVGNLAIVA